MDASYSAVDPEPSSSTSDNDEGSDAFESASETDWDLREQEQDGLGLPPPPSSSGGGNEPSSLGATADGDATVSMVAGSSVAAALDLTSVDSGPLQADVPPVARQPSEGGANSSQTNKSGSLFSGFSKVLGFSSASSSNAGLVIGEEQVSGTLIANIEGSWLSHINIAGTR